MPTYANVVAVHIILRRDDKVFLLQRANTGWADGCYCTPAGRLEHDELIYPGAARKAKGETGIKVSEDQLRLTAITNRVDTRGGFTGAVIEFFFEPTNWQGEPINGEPDNTSDEGWFPLNNLPASTLLHVRQVLEALAVNKPQPNPILQFGSVVPA